MKRPIVVGIGELLWDLLPDGRVLGGAPANFVYISHLLGADAHVVTCVGRDAEGDEALQRLHQAGLATDHCQRSGFPTGSAGVHLRDGQPCFTIRNDVAWDHITLDAKAGALMGAADAICFGTLAQRSPVSRAAIQSALMAARPECLRVFDCNLRQDYYSKDLLTESLRLATIARMNDAELPTVTKLLQCGDRADNLRAAFDLELVCVTRGDHGCLLASRETTVEHAGFPTQVVDAIGAGDAFTAAMTHGLLRGWPLERVAAFANSWGAFVASRRGAMPKVVQSEIAEIERRLS